MSPSFKCLSIFHPASSWKENLFVNFKLNLFPCGFITYWMLPLVSRSSFSKICLLKSVTVIGTVKGTCNHHDFAGVGAALPDSLHRFRVHSLQQWGVTAWRMSHNPPAPELLDVTDEAGMLVWDEIRHFGDFGLWRKEARDTILRDRNHPSIMMCLLCSTPHGCTVSGK